MREKKWTPGTWVISLANQQGVYDFGVSNEYMHICDICDDGGAAGYSEANARLVKAAPLLVEVLEKIVDSGTWYSSALEIDLYKEGAIDGEELEKMARFALATAYGEK